MSSSPDERRTAPRTESDEPIRLTIESTAIAGTCENISDVGVLFFSEEDLQVSVELEENGRKITRTGRLVRVQRMSLDNTGFAVEFDDA